MHKIAYISVILLCLGACVPGHNDYSQFKNIPDEGWSYNDTLTFIPEMTDSAATGLFTIAFRHTNDYLYSNLWVEVGHSTPTGNVELDTLNITFADVYGHWYGSGLGTSFQIGDTVSEAIHITKGKPITVRHIMRTDTLHGIEQVGILFISNDNKR